MPYLNATANYAIFTYEYIIAYPPPIFLAQQSIIAPIRIRTRFPIETPILL